MPPRKGTSPHVDGTMALGSLCKGAPKGFQEPSHTPGSTVRKALRKL